MSILLKKVTSAVSVVAIVAGAMSSTLVANAASSFAPYADALATAGIIGKQSTEAGYNLGNNVTRAEMAKVAVNINGAKTAECTGKVFSDVTSNLGDLCGYVEAAATAGLVNSTAAKFRPMDLVTRAEALKMLLSAKGIATSDVDAGFKDLGSDATLNGYINAAAAAGIINKGTSFNPNGNATRGEAFKIAANAAGLTTSATDTTGDINLGDLFGDLGTSTGTTSTGTTSTGTTSTGTTSTGTITVAAGDLSVGLNPATPVTGTQIPQTGIVRFSVVDLSAGGSDISVNTLELQKAGLATIPSGTKVWFEKAGTRVSGKASFTSENNAVISFAPAFVVKAGTTESLDMYVELASAGVGNDFAFASAAITSSAANVKGSFVTPTLRTASYTVASATIVGGASGQTYNASADSVEFAKFTVSNTDRNPDTRDIKVQSLTIYQNGSASLTNLSDIVLERNGVVVSTAAVVSGKTLTLTVNDTIKDGATAIYYVKAVVNNVELTSDTYQLYIKNTSDVNMVETASAFRATISSVAPINAATYIVNGGDVRFVRDTASTLSETVAPGTSDVTLMAGTITAKSAVTLEDINLGYTTTVATGSMSMNTVYLQIGAATFTATPDATFTGTLNFLGTATVNGTVPVRAYVKLRDTAAGTIKLSSFDINSVITRKEYVSNQNAVTSAIGSIEGRSITVGASTLNVTRTDGLGTTPLAAGAKGVTVYAARFSSTQGNPIALSNLSATTAGNALSYTGGNTSLTLYVDGVAVSTKSLTTATVNFAGFNSTVSTTQAVDIMIKADFSDVTTTGSFSVASIAYSAVDNLTSVTVASTSVAGATFNIASAVGALAATTGDMLVNKSLFTAGSKNQKIASFKVTASNDVIKLKDIVLTGTNLNALSNIRLVDSAMTVLGTASNVTTLVPAVAEVSTITLAGSATATGTISGTVNGVAYTATIGSGSTAASGAVTLAAAIGTTAVAAGSNVTITAAAGGVQTDITTASTATGMTAVAAVTTQGAAAISAGTSFANLNSGVGASIAMDQSVIFYVLADINSTTNVNGVVANVVVAGSDITGSNGAVVFMTGTTVAGASHDVSENTFKVAQTTPVSKALATNAIEFTVNAFGKNQVTLTGASIKTILGAYNPAGFTGATISIYTKSTNQLVGSTTGVTNGGTVIIPLNTYGVVSAGSSTTYVVKVEGLTLNTSTNEAWTVSLTSLVAGGLDAASYPLNTETFPLNSVK